MIRMIVSMPAEEKKWLEEYGRRHHLSAAEVIRRALKLYRGQAASPGDPLDILNRTHGKWKSMSGDSQAHIDRIRGSWERHE